MAGSGNQVLTCARRSAVGTGSGSGFRTTGRASSGPGVKIRSRASSGASGSGVSFGLVERADVLMHNFRPGVPERLGVDWPTLSAINPWLVYLYAGAYGADGPYSRLPGYHPIPGAICGNAVQQAGAGGLPGPDAPLSLEALKRASLHLGRANEGNPDANSAMLVGTAMMLGFNWPIGPISWGKRLGHPRTVEILDNLRTLHGEAYRAAPSLRTSAG